MAATQRHHFSFMNSTGFNPITGAHYHPTLVPKTRPKPKRPVSKSFSSSIFRDPGPQTAIGTRSRPLRAHNTKHAPKDNDIHHRSPQKASPMRLGYRPISRDNSSAGLLAGALSPRVKRTVVTPTRSDSAGAVLNQEKCSSEPRPTNDSFLLPNGTSNRGVKLIPQLSTSERSDRLGLSMPEPASPRPFQPIGQVKVFRPCVSHVAQTEPTPEHVVPKARVRTARRSNACSVDYNATSHAEHVVNEPRSVRSPQAAEAPWEQPTQERNTALKKVPHLSAERAGEEIQHSARKQSEFTEKMNVREQSVTAHVHHERTQSPSHANMLQVEKPTHHHEHVPSPTPVSPSTEKVRLWSTGRNSVTSPTRAGHHAPATHVKMSPRRMGKNSGGVHTKSQKRHFEKIPTGPAVHVVSRAHVISPRNKAVSVAASVRPASPAPQVAPMRHL